MNAKRFEIIISFLIPLLFILIAGIRLYPFENTLQKIIADSGNDWSKYAANALDIKHNGILMPSIEGAYEKPASFFYCYFLAFCFFLFGENNIPIYILQNLMLALSILFVWFTFRSKMSYLVSIAFLFTLIFFGLTDVSIYYTFRFLGENLALFSMSVFFFLFLRGVEKNSLFEILVSALFLGIAVLTRPNIFLFVILLITTLFLNYFYSRNNKFLSFIFLLIITCFFLTVRNYAVCGCFQFMPSQGVLFNMIFFHPIPSVVDIRGIDSNFDAYLQYFIQEPNLFIMHYVKKVLFCLGFLEVIVPSYFWFPHWTFMWFGYLAHLFFLIHDKTKITLHEKTVHLFIFTYFVSLILIGQIENYGFRMLLPGNFFVLSFAFVTIDRQWLWWKNKNNQS
jgi:hypothetical protein